MNSADKDRLAKEFKRRRENLQKRRLELMGFELKILKDLCAQRHGGKVTKADLHEILGAIENTHETLQSLLLEADFYQETIDKEKRR